MPEIADVVVGLRHLLDKIFYLLDNKSFVPREVLVLQGDVELIVQSRSTDFPVAVHQIDIDVLTIHIRPGAY